MVNIDDRLEALAAALRRSTVQVGRGGAGIVWRSDGLVVTNAHVVGGRGVPWEGDGRAIEPGPLGGAEPSRPGGAEPSRAGGAEPSRAGGAEPSRTGGAETCSGRAVRAERRRTVPVELWDGRRYDAEVLAVHARRDLAVLRIPARGLPAAPCGDSRSLRAGELVVALGHPLGNRGAATAGIAHTSGDGRWIKADIRLAPGNSGGPLANARGEIVGVNTLIQFSGTTRGLALAVPSHAVSRFLARGGDPGRLGVTLQPAVVPTPRGPGLGLVVVDAVGVAAQAGLAPGDVLIGEGEHLFREVDDLAWALEEAGAGGTVELLVLRGGQGRRLPVRLEAQPRAA